MLKDFFNNLFSRKKVLYENTGFLLSKLDGTEPVFGASAVRNIINLPESYSFKKFLPDVVNQGSMPTCVPCSISAFLNWRENMKNGVMKKDNGINYYQIYRAKTTPISQQGMSFIDAFNFLMKKGVDSKAGKLKIEGYANIKDISVLKKAIIMNGPCFAALPVFNGTSEFWIPRKGDKFKSNHAISIVGYNKEGFIIRNSWGKKFGDNGYTLLKYEDSDKLVEIWTIVE